MNKLQLFTILLICASLASCHSLVEDEFDDYKQIPVMNGLLQADSTFKVQISLTANLTDSMPDYVSNAQVIVENNMDTPDTLIYTEKGWYISSRKVKAGATYRCEATIPDYPILSAQTTIPLYSEPSSIVFTDLAGRGEEAEKISSVEFTIVNDITKNLFWEVWLITEGMQTVYNYETDEWTESFRSENEYIYMKAGQDSVLLNEANPLTVFSNKMMSADSYKVKFYLNANYTHFSSNDVPYIILRSVDESYYKYLKQYYIYETSGWINIGKSPQKYPLYSNVDNGLGLFTGVSITKKELPLNTGE